MTMFAGLDVLGRRTAMCVVEAEGKIGRGLVDTHPLMIDAALKRFQGKLAKVGLESGPFTPHLFRARGDLLSNGLHNYVVRRTAI
jgi:transposase